MRAPLRPSSHAAAAPITPAPIMAISHSRITSQDSNTAPHVATHQPRMDHLALRALAVALHHFKCAAVAAHVFAEDAIPGGNDDGDRAESLRLTGEANQRLRLIGVNV